MAKSLEQKSTQAQPAGTISDAGADTMHKTDTSATSIESVDMANKVTDMQSKTMPENATQQAMEKSTEYATKQTSDQVAGNVTEKATEQVTEAVAGQAAEQANQASQGVAEAMGQAAEQVASQAATAPLPMENAFTWGSYFQAIGTLLILLAILWGVVWLVRRYGRFNFLPKPGAFPRDGLRLESQLPLGPRKGLMVVRFLNKRLLLGVTDHQITLLKETADDNDTNNMEFKDVMEMAQRQKSDD